MDHTFWDTPSVPCCGESVVAAGFRPFVGADSCTLDFCLSGVRQRLSAGSTSLISNSTVVSRGNPPQSSMK